MPIEHTGQGYLFRNWAGTEQAHASELSWPTSDDEVARTLRRAGAQGRRVKVVGAGHSWSAIAMPQHQLMSLDRMQGLVRVDHARGEATVRGGTRLFALNRLLEAEGLAMPVLGSVDQQSIAGAIATGTHGSGPRLGNLASAVASLRMVLPSGEVAEASPERDPELFCAARVGLGALGVVTEVTLRCVPSFRLEEDSFPLPFDEALDRLPSLLKSEEFVKLWWLPHTDQMQVSCYRRTARASTFRAAARWVDERLVNGLVFTAILRAGDRAPASIAAANRAVGAAYFRPARRVAHSYGSFHIAMPPPHDEAEASLPVAEAAPAMRWLRDFIERERLAVNFVAELRFGAGDDAWLSPAHGRDSCFLGAYIANGRDRDRYFDGFEAEMRRRHGRPHWGKAFRAGADALRPLYPRYDDFAALRRSLDPDGTLLNPLLERLFPPR